MAPHLATLATIAGAFLIPTFQRLSAVSVEAVRSAALDVDPRIESAVALDAGPSPRVHRNAKLAKLSAAHRGPHIPWGVAILNAVAVAIWTVGVFAALYAGYLRPELRVTSSQLSSVVNGVATIVMFGFVDPYLSFLTDDVAGGRLDEAYFRRSIVWLTGGRLVGTVLAQALLVPAAGWIAFVAARI